MIIDARRLLGFAFAGADLLIELDDSGKVAFGAGATQAMLGVSDDAVVGKTWRDFVLAADRPMVDSLLDGLIDGARCGPITIRLMGEGNKTVAFGARRLAANGNRICCAMTPTVSVTEMADTEDGLFPAEQFNDVARRIFETSQAGGVDLEMAMVELNGLSEARKAMSVKERADLDLKVAGALRAQSQGGSAVSRLSDERFALLRVKDPNGIDLADRVSKAVAAHCVAGVKPAVHALAIDGDGASSRVMRAVKAAIEDFSRDGLAKIPPKNLTEAMSQSVRKQLAKAGELGLAVSQRRFNLAYQPVVSLTTGEAHHHEALLRFEGGGSPQAQVRIAEEFDLIEELDNAVAEKVIQRLQADGSGKLHLAANVSGQTIISPPFISLVEGLLKTNPGAKDRFIIEVTETAAIDDLGTANRHIQALRKMGILVCLDDFGSGSASLAYLQKINFDIVKIDGRYIRELLSSSRDGALVRHVVGLCNELKLKTVAEMVESPEVEDIVRKAGVHYSQGWLYGQPTAQPEPPVNRGPIAPAKRRAGAVESWG